MDKTNFLAYMASVISRLEKEGRLGTAHVYRSTRRRVVEFEGKEELCFQSLTAEWLKSFQEHLLLCELKWNTVSTYMRMLRAVYTRAVDDGLAEYRPRLFKSVYTGGKSVVKRALDKEVLRKLKAPVETSEKLERTRLLFVLLFMLRGIPFVDIAYMRRCDLEGETLAYRRRKTGAWLTVHVEPEAMDIIRRLANPDTGSPYLFPFIRRVGHDEYRQYQNALRSFNYNLKALGRHIGVPDNLSSYSARHSWATIANYRNYQQILICNAMGHSSVKVTETYLKGHTDESINKMNREIITYTFTKE